VVELGMSVYEKKTAMEARDRSKTRVDSFENPSCRQKEWYIPGYGWGMREQRSEVGSLAANVTASV
jgi:hypothetical protein